MKKLYFCTTKLGKKKKLEKDFAAFGRHISLEILDIAVNEIQELDNTLVAKEKVKSVFSQIQQPCLTIDSWLYIHALHDFPGSYLKMTLETIGIESLVHLLKDKEQRTCEIRNCLAYYDGASLQSFTEILEWRIAEAPFPELLNDYAWSNLYKIFIPQGYDSTLAAMNNSSYLKRDAQRNQTGMIKQFLEWYDPLP